jgi:hypothetical protein
MFIKEVESSFEGKLKNATKVKASASTEVAKEFFEKNIKEQVLKVAKEARPSLSLKLTGSITEHFNLQALRKLLRKEGFEVFIAEPLSKEEYLELELSGWVKTKRSAEMDVFDLIEAISKL